MLDDRPVWKARLIRRLNVVVDLRQPYHVRLAAVRAVQAMMDANNPLRRESADDLLARVLKPFDRREVLVDQRAVQRQVYRPVRSLRDVFE